MTFSTVATYNVPAHHPLCLIIARGSVVEFSYPPNPQRAAIVNSVSGFAGGVDDAVSDAGGPNLMEDRKKFPIAFSEGSAVMTGPYSYGRLKVSNVIYASGGYSDQSLSSAYTSSLECGKKSNIEAIAFSLLSAGGFRGSRSIDHVVKIGLDAIRRFDGYAGLKAIYMCAFTKAEEEALIKIANKWLVTPTSNVKNALAVTKKPSIFLKVISTLSQKKAEEPRDEAVSSLTGSQLVPNEQGKSTEMDSISDILETNSIDYTNKGLGDKDAVMVAQALEESTTIESIYMNGNRLAMLDTRFTRALALNHTLKFLWLENNQIYADGAGRLANALVLNGTIQHIYLGRNYIRDDGAGRLAEALHINQTIKSIDLHHNGIGNIGAERIADAILANHSLQSMDLQRNQIGDTGGCSLADALQGNNIITKLELSYNTIGGTVQQRVNDILAGPRPLPMKKQPNVKSSLFFGKLMELEEDCSGINENLEVLSMFITDVHMMKFYYTAVAIFQCSGVLTQEAASRHIQRGLCRTSETCSCSDSISCFKLILEKAESDNHIQRIDFHRYDNRAEVNRMESAPFIVGIIDAVKSNTARIEGLEANLEAIDVSLNSIRDGLKRQMKIEAAVGFLCAALNAISFGVGGSILDATINALGSIVDYSDLAHIQDVAAEWGDGCVEQVETGVSLASDQYAEKLLHEAVKKKETLTIISATAAMINAQYLIKPNHTNLNHPIKMASSSETMENQLELSQQDEHNQFLTNEKSCKEVMQWLSSHLPQLQKDDAMKYCECLIEDGFDSVDMLGDVREEDLNFMKKAHKRNLIQRIKRFGKTMD